MPKSTEGKITIRSARASDAPDIQRVGTSCIEMVYSKVYGSRVVAPLLKEYSSADFIESILSNESVVVATECCSESDTKQLLGFGCVGKSNNSQLPQECELELKKLYVAPEHQGRGVGGLIVQELEERAIARVQELELCSGVKLCVMSSLNAVPFYESRGFEYVKDGQYFVAEHTIPLKILQKELSTAFTDICMQESVLKLQWTST